MLFGVLVQVLFGGWGAVCGAGHRLDGCWPGRLSGVLVLSVCRQRVGQGVNIMMLLEPIPNANAFGVMQI